MILNTRIMMFVIFIKEKEERIIMLMFSVRMENPFKTSVLRIHG